MDDTKKTVTEEEVNKILWEYSNSAKSIYVVLSKTLIERMWEEIKELRSSLQKQIY